MMKNCVFILPDGQGLGGVTTWSIEMAQQLARIGHPVTLLEHINLKLHESPVISPGVQLIRQSGRPPTYVRPADIRHYLPAYREALPGIFIPNYSFGTYAACAALATQQPEAMHVLGFAHTDQYYYYQLLKYYEPLIHRFVAVSEEIAQTLGNWIPHRRADIVTQPYGVQVPVDLQRQYSSSTTPIQLMYAGRLVEYQKRVSELITLAEILGRRNVNFDLRIAGEGPERSYLQRTAQALPRNVQEKVRFEGHIPYERMSEQWQSADICVLTSEYEGTSIAMLEAMANGCVPVVTRVSGTSSVIVPGQNGYFAEVGNIATLAQHIEQLANERTALPRLGYAARRTIVDNFSLPAYLTWFDALLQEVAALPPRPWPPRHPFLPRFTMFYLGWIAMSPWLWRARRWRDQMRRNWKQRS